MDLAPLSCRAAHIRRDGDWGVQRRLVDGGWVCGAKRGAEFGVSSTRDGGGAVAVRGGGMCACSAGRRGRDDLAGRVRPGRGFVEDALTAWPGAPWSALI